MIAPPLSTEAMLDAHGVEVVLGRGSGRARILSGVDLTIREGRVMGLVGESGSGKSTLAGALVGTVPLAAGRVAIAGQDVHTAPSRRLRRTVQLIPQDPYSSLDPRRTIAQTIAEAIDPLHPSVTRDEARIAHALAQVRLPADAARRRPHEFSGGQRQRIAIARGLAVEPRLVIADEITSALDVSVQADVLALLARLREELRLTMLFISHNLAVVRSVCDDVAVMRHGQIVERGPVDEVFRRPRHPYTRLLLDSVPGAPGFTIDTSPLSAESGVDTAGRTSET
ncbi:ABC transporter ATP-binding protein [Microbacterium sp. SORGH_AS_0888]|uniref:ABC transporter ATP-binding protein n=1 Tax=Microbacterium sp. SORGH_AS_0888 TaxID=3041791 RepID=UPI00277E62F6|nr:ABC transporter ATP-binding protein [Microbacterium sp. SORGH_AS_0888]MDQ1129317.1 ABC-type glutathione transport system ATPase component [Microbacterium sp. SORGH_AS_0888]